MTSPNHEFLDYAIKYSSSAREQRQGFSDSERAILTDVEDNLADNPKAYPGRTTPLTESVAIYRHPSPQLEVTYELNEEAGVISILHIVVPKLDVIRPLFISYSHEDVEWLTELKKYLRPLEKANLIQIWDDSEIKAGQEWATEIAGALNNAKVALLLISQDFLDSKFISNVELPKLLDAAEERGTTILWVALRASTVDDSEIARFQAVHKDPPLSELDETAREAQFVNIYQRVKQAVES